MFLGLGGLNRVAQITLRPENCTKFVPAHVKSVLVFQSCERWGSICKSITA